MPFKEIIVETLAKLANRTSQESAALEELLQKTPEILHIAVRRRFCYEVGIIAERAARQPQPQPRQSGPSGVFDMAAAVLLMATEATKNTRLGSRTSGAPAELVTLERRLIPAYCRDDEDSGKASASSRRRRNRPPGISPA